MRTEWVPVSASALVVGAMALVLGSLLDPATGNQNAVQTLQVVNAQGGRWLGMSVMYFCASVALTLGLPAVLSLFTRRARRIGITGVAVFAIGVIGLCGFAMLLVFFRALANNDAIRAAALVSAAHDTGFAVFLYGWIVGFYLGLLLIAIALFIARKTPKWVPVLLLVFVATLPLSSHLGRVGQAVQVLALAVAFTGIAIAAVSAEHRRELQREPVF